MSTNEEQLEITPTLEERIAEGVRDAYIQHGYVLTIGDTDVVDKHAVEAKVYGLVSSAVVTKRADRGKVAISKRTLMSKVFSEIPGPEGWAEQTDPEWAKGVYSKLEGALWRLVDPNAAGKVQSTLNGDSGLILCKTTATPDKIESVYVTTDLQCLLADFSLPQRTKLKKEVDKFASNLAMAVSRQPGYAKQFDRELTSGMKTALQSGQAVLKPAIEAATDTLADSDGESDDNGED